MSEPDASSWLLTDGVVTIRPPTAADVGVLIAGQDDESRRYVGEATGNPTACIVVDDTVVGWVDFDHDRDGLKATEVNMGYNVFPPYRRNGYAWRALVLLLQRLADEGRYEVGTLSIDRDNEASLGVAAKAGFAVTQELPDVLRLARPVGQRPN